jgi:peptidoglycan/xylan/chitin deacetylase (PgdA/CDA1 family)
MSKTTLVFGVTYHGSINYSATGLANVYGKHIGVHSLKEQLAWLARHFRIMTINEILDRARRGTLPTKSAFIAFHDGYRGNYETAFPLLKALDIQVDFFIPTAFIGTQRRFWVDILDAALKHTRLESLTLPGVSNAAEAYPLQGEMERLAATHRLRNRLKSLSRAEFEPEFKRVLNALGWGDPSEVPNLGEHAACLDWDQVREMSKAGMGIGSHTHRHMICATQKDEVVREEMETSKKLIERETGQPCLNFCYPNGRFPGSGNENTDRIAREQGYQSVLYMMAAPNLIHADTYRLTGAALGEGSELDKVKGTFSSLRFRWRRWRGDRIWAWDKDTLDASP